METNKSALLAAYEKVTRGVKSCALSLSCSQCPFHNYNGMSCRDGLLKETNQFFDNIKEHISKLFDPENSDRNTDEREELITALRCITSEHLASSLKREDYVKVGDLIDCLKEVTMPEEAAFYLENLLEWAIGKRSISKFEIYPLSLTMQIQPDKIDFLEKYFIGIPLDANADSYEVVFGSKPIEVKPQNKKESE